MVLALSGCDSFTVKDQLEIWEDEDRLEFIDGLRDCYDSNFDEDWCYEIDDARYYTKEELNEIFDFAEQDWTVQDFVDYIDDLEDIIDLQEQRIIELESE